MTEADTYSRLSSGKLMEALIRRTLMEDDVHEDRNNIPSSGGGSAFKRWKQRALNDQAAGNTASFNVDTTHVDDKVMHSSNVQRKKFCDCRVKCECSITMPDQFDSTSKISIKQEILETCEIEPDTESGTALRQNARENHILNWQQATSRLSTSETPIESDGQSHREFNHEHASHGTKKTSGSSGLLLRALTEQPEESPPATETQETRENKQVENKKVANTIPKKRARSRDKSKPNVKYLKEPPPGYYDEWLKNIGLLKEGRPRYSNENSPIGPHNKNTNEVYDQQHSEESENSCDVKDDGGGRKMTMEMTIATMIERTLDASMHSRHGANRFPPKMPADNHSSNKQYDSNVKNNRDHSVPFDVNKQGPKRRFFGVGKIGKKTPNDEQKKEFGVPHQSGILRQVLGTNSETERPSSETPMTNVSKSSEHNAYEFSDEASLQTDCEIITKIKTEPGTVARSPEAAMRAQLFIKVEEDFIQENDNGGDELRDRSPGGEHNKPSVYCHSSGSEIGGRGSPSEQPQKKKKRKRCGTCEPCMTKENCGECSSCKNRRTGHQICKMRKCVQLRRKLAPLIAPHALEELERKDREKKERLLENAKNQTSTEAATSTTTTTTSPTMNPQVPPQASQQQPGVLLNGHSPHYWDPYQSIQDEKARVQHLAAAKGHPHMKGSYQHLFQQEFAARNDFRTTGSPGFNQSTQVAGHQLHNQVALMQNSNERTTPNPQTDMRYLPQQALLEAVPQKETSSNLPPTKTMDVAQSLLSLHSGIRETASVGSPDSGSSHSQPQMHPQIDPHNIAAKGNQWNMFDPNAVQQHAQNVGKDNTLANPNYHRQANGQQASVVMDASQASRYQQKLHRPHPYQQPHMDPNYRMHSPHTNSNQILQQNCAPNMNTEQRHQLPSHPKKFPPNFINRFHERFANGGMNPIMSMEMLSKEMNPKDSKKAQKTAVEQTMRIATPEQSGKQHANNVPIEQSLQTSSKGSASPFVANNNMGFMDTPTVISSVEKLEQTKTKISKSKSRSETPKLNSSTQQENSLQSYGQSSSNETKTITKPQKTKDHVSAEIALKNSLRQPRPTKKLESAHTLDPPKPLLTPLGPPVLNTRPSKMVTIVNPCNTPPRSPPPPEKTTVEGETKEDKSEGKAAEEVEEEKKKKRKSIADTVEQEYEHWEMTKRLEEDAKVLPPDCNCGEVEKDDAPYYTHLGAGPSIKAIRKMMEERYGESGAAVRIEKLVYSGKEGKTELGCPIAKWIIRRSGKSEKMLVLVRHRFGHSCETAFIIIGIILWEGVQENVSDNLYTMLSTILPKHGSPTVRRCGTNEEKSCACQGTEDETSGASFSFGCSWLMYYNGCKFARSKTPRKFKLDGSQEEEIVETELQNLATYLSPMYKQMAPASYEHQVHFEKEGNECRIGYGTSRPFGGVTTCMDFCAHAHRDQQNMNNGCTVVVTLTKEEVRNIKPDPGDEQLHVLPLYYLDSTDEHGDPEGQRAKVQSGAIEVLTNYCKEVRLKPKDQIVPRGRGKRNKDSSSDSPSKRAKASAQSAAAESEAKEANKKTVSEVVVKDEFKRIGPQHRVQLSNKHMQETNVSAYNQRNHWQMARQTDNLGIHLMNGMHPGIMGQQSHLGMAYPYEMYSQYPAYPQYFPIPGLLGQDKIHPEANMHGIHQRFQGHLPGVHMNPFMHAQSHVRPQFEDVKPDVRRLNALMAQSDFQGAAMLHRQDTPSAMYGPHGQPIPQIDLTRHDHWNRAASIEHGARPVGGPASFHAPVVSGFGLPGQHQAGPGARGPVDPSLQSQQLGQQNPSSIWRPPIEDKVTKNAASPQDSGTTSASTPKPGTVDLNTHTPKNSGLMFGNQASPHNFPGQAANQCPGRPGSNQSAGGNVSKDASSVPGFYPQDLARPEVNESRQDSQGTNIQMFPESAPGQLHANQMQMHPAQANLHASQGNLHHQQANLHRQQMAAQMQHMPTGHQLKPQDQPAGNDIKSLTPPTSDHETYTTSNAHCFRDATIGGVAVALTHGSVLFEVAKRELHATTALHRPCRQHPSRISLVFYQHKHLNVRNHGMKEYEDKMMARHQEQEEAARLAGEETPTKGRRKAGNSAKDSNSSKNPSAKVPEIPLKRANTQTTESLFNTAPEMKCIVSGPYQKWSWGQTPQLT
ncbi:uncharacterized protein [Antedon mediterranea]|uniref:uncharacterized protein n=1 Tax=Antedon mediterranea TaxID=105859 RepID=UPI003AF41B35